MLLSICGQHTAINCMYIYIYTLYNNSWEYMGNMRTEGVTSYRYIWYNTRQWKSRVIWGSKPCTPGEYPNSSMSINMLITLLFSYVNIDQNTYYVLYIYIYGSVSKPCTPVVHIKIAGIYGCSSH